MFFAQISRCFRIMEKRSWTKSKDVAKNCPYRPRCFSASVIPVAGQIPRKGPEGGPFLLAFQKGDYIDRSGESSVVHSTDDLITWGVRSLSTKKETPLNHSGGPDHPRPGTGIRDPN